MYSKLLKYMHVYAEIFQVSKYTCTYCRLGDAYDVAQRKTCQHKKVASKESYQGQPLGQPGSQSLNWHD